jgi:hypothetical protein
MCVTLHSCFLFLFHLIQFYLTRNKFITTILTLNEKRKKLTCGYGGLCARYIFFSK